MRHTCKKKLIDDKKIEYTIPDVNDALIYPAFFNAAPGIVKDEFTFANVDNDLNLETDEYDGHNIRAYALSGVRVYNRTDNASTYESVMTAFDNDTTLFVTDSRIAFIREKALLAGHIRYEWIAGIYYTNAADNSGSGLLRILYKDQSNYIWNITFNMDSADVESVANDILRRTAIYRNAMTNDKSPALSEFISRYISGENRIPISNSANSFNSVTIPVFYFAGKGKEYRP